MPMPETLIIPPYVGEFGWELMNWQGRVRRVVRESRHRRILIAAQPDRRPLYADLIDHRRVRFCPMPPMDWLGEANDDHRVDASHAPISPPLLAAMIQELVGETLCQLGLEAAGADWFLPSFNSALWPTTKAGQDFAHLGILAPIQFDVVLVTRMRTLAGERNQPASWWEQLATKLRDRGLRVAFYESSMIKAIRQLSATRLAAGASTGGLHLASLCECPHFVWGPGAESRWTPLRITNRQRYETIWNPFGAPCVYQETGWKPSMEQAFEGILDALNTIAVRPEGTRTNRFRPRWRIKRGLAKVLESGSSRSRWPWRLQELVRMRLM